MQPSQIVSIDAIPQLQTRLNIALGHFYGVRRVNDVEAGPLVGASLGFDKSVFGVVVQVFWKHSPTSDEVADLARSIRFVYGLDVRVVHEIVDNQISKGPVVN